METFILVCLLVLIVVLAKNLIEPALAFLGLLGFYYFLGLIDTSSFLSSFVNKSIVILTLLIVVADIISRTQITKLLDKFLGTKKSQIFKTGLLVSCFSSFLSNTLVVQLFIKVLEDKDFKSKVLLPISYMAILGGTLTAIGTSTNIIANGFLLDRGLPLFNFFDFAYVGVPVVLAGLIYLSIFSDKILKKDVVKQDIDDSKYFLEAKVVQGSTLHGKTVSQNKLRHLDTLFLAQIIRGEDLISPVTPEETILEEDVLVFTGDISNVKELKKFDKLEIFEQNEDVLNENLVWTVVSHNSELLNKKIKDCDFRKKYNAAIVAIKRQGEKLHGKIGEIVLKAGDQLVLAVGNDFDSTSKEVRCNFYLLNDIKTSGKIGFKNTILILTLFLLAVSLAALKLVPLIKGLLVLIFVYMVCGFVNFKQVLKSINIRLIILLGSALGISKVLISNGVSEVLSSAILAISSDIGVYGTLVVVYFFSLILTELTMNASAVAISFPIAYVAATSLGVNPMTFIMAVTFGSSASFLTKFGYQTNMLVSGAGSYKSKDFLKLGLPLSLIYSVVVLILLPIVFKF